MLSRSFATSVVFALCLSVSVRTPAFACACCSSEGQRLVETEKIDSYAAAQLAEMKFAATAHLYTGEADVESIKGVAARSPDFVLAVAKGDTSWRFDFKQDGAEGTLTLAMPHRVTRFEVDPRATDGGDAGTGPTLYKEWRLAVTPRGTGVFAGATGGGQQATLILHGSGNSCTDASQFRAWTLVLHGPKDTVSFYGDLVVP